MNATSASTPLRVTAFDAQDTLHLPHRTTTSLAVCTPPPATSRTTYTPAVHADTSSGTDCISGMNHALVGPRHLRARERRRQKGALAPLQSP